MVVDTLVSLTDLLCHNSEVVDQGNKLPQAILNQVHAVLQERKGDPGTENPKS